MSDQIDTNDPAFLKARQLGPVARITPRRAPGTSGRRPPNYPELNFGQLGRSIGVSATYIGRIMNGVSRPSMQVAERLAAVLGWSIDQVAALYKGTGEKTNGKSRNRRTKRNRTNRTNSTKL